MTIVQWNCEGLKQKVDALKEVIREKDPICLCLQETKLKQDKDLKINGFKSFLESVKVREGENAHGGVGIWVQNNKPAHRIPLRTNLQAVAVSLVLHRRITICSVYLPPNEVIPRRDIERLIEQLPKPFLLLGDFNAHCRLWYDSKDCARGKVIRKIIEDRDIFLLDREKYTHFSRAHATKSHIDLSISSLDLHEDFDWDVDDCFRTSDHAPIYIKSKIPDGYNYEQRWITKKADWKTYIEKTEINANVEQFNNTEDAVDHLGSIIENAAEQSIPKSKGNGSKKNPPWWNEQCKVMINKRKSAWKKYTRVTSLENLLEFKKARAEAQRTVRRSKRASWQEFIEGIDTTVNSKEAWRKINILLNKHGSRSQSSLKIGTGKSTVVIKGVPKEADVSRILHECYGFGPVHRIRENIRGEYKEVSITFQNEEAMREACRYFDDTRFDENVINAQAEETTENSNFLDEPIEIAESLGLQFEYVSSQFSCDPGFMKNKKRRERKLNFKTNRAFEYNRPITEGELARELEKVKDSAPGPDGIHYSMLKNLAPSGKQFLLEILNKIFSTGKMPKAWKLAHVIPIPKEGKDPLKPDSYRPIALTSCICKLFERILNRRLVRYLANKKLITEAQAGFMKGKNTIDNLIGLESEIHESFLRNEYLMTVFFDLAKAYDTCWRYLIVEELHNSGMRGNLPNLIVDFLSDRKFHVRVCGKLSRQFSQDMGVPQGSVLSATLFLIAINTISRIVNSFLTFSLYVDDIRVSVPVVSTDWSRANRRMQTFLNKLVKWSNETGFKFSEEKTVVMVFHRIPGLAEQPSPKLYLYDRGKPLKVVEEKKFLGLILDRKLNWVPHLKYLRNKCASSINMLRVIVKNNRRTECNKLMNVYRAITRAKLDYGCEVYGSASKTALKMIDPIHHQALRVCTGAFRTSPRESLYVEAKEPSLTDRRKLLLLQYYIRINRIPDSTVMKHMNDTALDNRYRNSRRKPKSVAYKLRQLCGELDIVIPTITPFYQCNLGPWEIPKIVACLELAQHSKKETSEEIYRNHFQEHRHTADIEIYTDGSKGETGVGAGVVVIKGDHREEYSYKLNNMASVFTAELMAIKVGLSNVVKYSNKNCVLYSDSMSSLQAIQSAKVEDKRIGIVYEILERLSQNHLKVSFCWIPGHAGIEGNEIADKIAKRACSLPQQESLEVDCSDCKAYVKPKIRDNWENRWRSLTDNKKLKSLQESIDKKIMKLSRKDDIKLTRLRIGHTRLTHGFLLLGEDVPMCMACDVPISVKHILIECGDNIIDRMECYDHRNVNLKILLNSSQYIPKVLEFLKRVDLYKEI